MAQILFVDDDPYTLETLTKATEVIGHQALLASNGQEALNIATEKSPDLIFIDIRLADMDGLALTSLLKEQEATAHIPVLVLSASPEMDVVDNVHAAGAQGFLNKPIRLQTLLDVIQEHTTE